MKTTGNAAIVNAIDCAWIAIGNLWMFSGLMVLMKKSEEIHTTVVK